MRSTTSAACEIRRDQAKGKPEDYETEVLEGFSPRHRGRTYGGVAAESMSQVGCVAGWMCRRLDAVLIADAAGRQLDVSEPPAVDQTNLERVTSLLVELCDAMVCGRGAADMAPAVRLQSGPHPDREAVDLHPTPIREPRGLYRRRLDDRGLVGQVREPVRQRDVFELASSRPGRRGSA